MAGALVVWVRAKTFSGVSAAIFAFTALSAVVAVVFLVQAAVTAWIIASTSFSAAYHWDQILPIVALVVAMMLTFVITRRGRQQGAALQAAASGD